MKLQPPTQRLRAYLTLFGGVMAIVGVVAFAYKAEVDGQRTADLQQLRLESTELTDFFANSLRVTKTKMRSVIAYFEASDLITESEFARYITQSQFFQEGLHLRAIAVMPEIASDQVRFFNDRLATRSTVRRELGYPEWTGIEPTGADEYLPATYVESPAGRAGVLGFDLTSSAERMEAATLARQTHEISMTRPVGLSQDADAKRPSVLLLAYTSYGPLGYRAEEANRADTAFVGVGYTPAVHIDSVLGDHPSGLSVNVVDVTEPDAPILIYESAVQTETIIVHTSEVVFAQRIWRLSFLADPAVIGDAPDWLNFFLISVILLTLAGAYSATRLINNEAVLIDRVRERTAELQEQNVKLQNAQTISETALSRAQEVSRMKSQFLATMSHEFRTPLNAIIGFTDFILAHQGNPKVEAKSIEYLQDIMKSGNHMLNLVNDILDVAALEVGKRELRREKFDLVSEAEEVLASLRSLSDSNDVDLVLDHDSDFGDVNFDRTAIRQVILNLLSNAIKFSPSGSPVTTRLSRHENDVLIEVSDQGPGIPTEALESLTDPFTRVHSDPMIAREGSGLGLSVTKGLVELHGGELVIDSEQGVGTTVFVILPASD